LGASYSNADYVRAIRHGVDPQGRGLMIMHSNVYHNLSQQDLGAMIAYLKSVPPVDNATPAPKIEPLGRILVALGVFDSEALPLIPAEGIDHSAPFAELPPQGATAEYGSYLMSITLCHMCHGPDLAGAPPLDPGMEPGPNLTPGGELGGWSAADFIQTMRTGVSPQGDVLNPDFMPWKEYANMTDDELKSLWLYLQSLPAVSSTE
jgi:cytochrome c553